MHIVPIRLTILTIFLLSLSGCFDQEKKGGLHVINVLDKELYDDCHIKDSVHVTLDQLDEYVADLDKEAAHIVIYCSNYLCTASGFAAKKLQDMGFKHVWAYEAGMAEWYQQGLPIESAHGEKCKKGYLHKKMRKPKLDESSEIRIISTDELARKMKFVE